MLSMAWDRVLDCLMVSESAPSRAKLSAQALSTRGNSLEPSLVHALGHKSSTALAPLLAQKMAGAMGQPMARVLDQLTALL
jgi:hypothetical protein